MSVQYLFGGGNKRSKLVSLDELLARFKNGKERYANDPVFRSTIDFLIKGGDPIDMIDLLFDLNTNHQKKIERLSKIISKGVETKYIVTTKEQIKRFG